MCALDVQIAQALEDLLNVDRDEAFGEAAKLGDGVGKGAGLHELQHNVEVVFRLDGRQVFDDVWVVEVVQKLDFTHHPCKLFLGNVVQGNLLDGHHITGIHVQRLVYRAIVALAYHLAQLVVLNEFSNLLPAANREEFFCFIEVSAIRNAPQTAMHRGWAYCPGKYIVQGAQTRFVCL